jgi:hypothetical protein
MARTECEHYKSDKQIACPPECPYQCWPAWLYIDADEPGEPIKKDERASIGVRLIALGLLLVLIGMALNVSALLMRN